MNISIVQPRLSYYKGGGEKYPIESLPLLAKSHPDIIFTIYTTKRPLYESDIYKSFKNDIVAYKNIILKELDVPTQYSYLYTLAPGEIRFRWDIESYFFANLVLNEILNTNIRPDIIWSYYLLDFPFKLKGIKTILNLLGYPRIKSDYREAILTQYDLIVSINKNTINKWNELLDIKISSYECLGLGIDRELKGLDTEIPSDTSYFNIVFAGRLMKRKGIIDLCEALRDLLNQGKKTRLYILGEGTLSETIKNYISKSKLENNIFLLGFVNNVSDYFNSADIIVLPSYPGEGQMSTVIEAMYFNGNVITTIDNGNEDYIENNVSGYLIEPGNVKEIVKIISSQIEGKVDLDALRIAARNNVKLCNWIEYCKEFRKICENIE